MAVPRKRFTARRRHLGFSQESLARALNVASNTVGSWERGDRTPSARYRRALSKLLQVSLAQLDLLLDEETAPLPPCHFVPNWLGHYGSLIVGAGSIWEVQSLAIPALLQTRAYAAAIEYTSGLPIPAEQIDAMWELRRAQQEACFEREEPVQLVTLLSDGVVSDVVGSREVMVEQLDHLIELSERPNVDIRIIGPGQAPAAISGFKLLTRPGEHQPYLVATLSLDGPSYVELEDRVATFAARFEQLLSTALTPFETRRRLIQIRNDHLMEMQQR